jgi:hypothetical protein
MREGGMILFEGIYWILLAYKLVSMTESKAKITFTIVIFEFNFMSRCNA